MKVPKRKKRIWSVVLVCVLALILVLAAASAWIMSTLSLEIQLNGDKQVTIQHGESYTDPGATAVLKSGILGEYKLDLPVSAEDHVDITTPGQYSVLYKFAFMWLQATPKHR